MFLSELLGKVYLVTFTFSWAQIFRIHTLVMWSATRNNVCEPSASQHEKLQTTITEVIDHIQTVWSSQILEKIKIIYDSYTVTVNVPG